MSDQLGTVWEIEPHTIAKHIILKNYLKAWFPIMSHSGENRLLFIDAYAGPGIYAGNHDGSPIIALREAMNFLDVCDKRGWGKPEIVFLFIEQDPERYKVLVERLESMHLPKKIKVNHVNSSFEEVGTELMDLLEKKESNLAPAFVFIDPFGYNLSFELVKRLMSHPKCEVFINFMYEFINRFIRRDGQEKVMTNLFGTTEWSKLSLDGKSAAERRETIHDFYQERLQNEAARYVRSFQMKGVRNATKYFLFYGTNHKLGLARMKEAMWKVDTGGNYTFSDATDPNQLVLFGNEPDFDLLKHLITNKFSGEVVSVSDIEDFVLIDTPFLTTHFKMQILNPMEKSGELRVILSPRKRKGAFPEGTIIQFR